LGAPPRLPRWFLRLSFHLLYNQLAWAYELVAWLVSFGQWSAWRRAVLLFVKEGPILELGFGTGGLMADMKERPVAPIGVDLSPYMARLARRRLLRQGATPRLVRGQAQHLPFSDASFANVVATFPTDFILDPQTLADIARILQPRGCLVVAVVGRLQGLGPMRSLVEWLYRITGQREIPEPKPLARLREFGFTARWEDVTHEGADVRLLVATRSKE
jgi:ubiquinone/menaquinone biosynthesis C-methylase UbiE